MKVNIYPPKDNSKIKSIVDLSHVFKLSTKSAREFFEDNVDVIPTEPIIISEDEVKLLESRGWKVVELGPKDFDWVKYYKDQDEALAKAEAWVSTLSDEEKEHIEVLRKSMIPMG